MFDKSVAVTDSTINGNHKSRELSKIADVNKGAAARAIALENKSIKN